MTLYFPRVWQSFYHSYLNTLCQRYLEVKHTLLYRCFTLFRFTLFRYIRTYLVRHTYLITKEKDFQSHFRHFRPYLFRSFYNVRGWEGPTLPQTVYQSQRVHKGHLVTYQGRKLRFIRYKICSHTTDFGLLGHFLIVETVLSPSKYFSEFVDLFY